MHASVQVMNARVYTRDVMRLFGHVLRMNENAPARQAVVSYFNENSQKGRLGTFCTIASVISDEHNAVFKKSVKTKSEYEAVAVLARDRERWRLERDSPNVTQKYCESRKEKVSEQREVRKKAELKEKRERTWEKFF